MASTASNSDTLVLVTVIFRHGDRTPDSQCVSPANPFKSESYHPYKHGELTHTGQQRMIKVGSDLRTRYQSFLGDVFYTDMVQSTTSSYTRCQMSLQCVHAGLFPPAEKNIPQEDLNWQAVPFNIIPFAEDKWISIHISNPKFMQNLEHENLNPEDINLLHLISYNAGYEKVELINAFRIYDFYKTLVETGHSVEDFPEWIQEIWPSKIRRLAYLFWFHFQRKRKYIGAGPFMKRLIEEHKFKVEEGDIQNGRKMYLYAVHDMNLHLLRGALNIWTNEPIEYGAHLILELHKIGEEHSIRVLFQNGYDQPKLISVPGFKELMPLSEFDLFMEYLYDGQENVSV